MMGLLLEAETAVAALVWCRRGIQVDKHFWVAKSTAAPIAHSYPALNFYDWLLGDELYGCQRLRLSVQRDLFEARARHCLLSISLVFTPLLHAIRGLLQWLLQLLLLLLSFICDLTAQPAAANQLLKWSSKLHFFQVTKKYFFLFTVFSLSLSLFRVHQSVKCQIAAVSTANDWPSVRNLWKLGKRKSTYIHIHVTLSQKKLINPLLSGKYQGVFEESTAGVRMARCFEIILQTVD